MMLLPFLVEDRHIPAAMPIFDRLDPEGIAAELRWLGDANDFQATRLSALLIDRAREVGGLLGVRDVLISFRTSARRDELLARTVEPVWADMHWLLDEKRLSEAMRAAMLVNVLRRADNSQFEALLSDRRIGERVVACLPDDAVDMLARAVDRENLPINAYVRVIRSVIPKVDDSQKFEIVGRVIGRCLRNRFDGDEAEFLSMLLGILGAQLDGKWAARAGLERGINAECAMRNLIAFEKAPPPARERIVGAVDEIARALQGRHFIDLSDEANDACARLMFDAEKTATKALVYAAGWLMPSLLRAHRQHVSLMIAALFPIIYRELTKPADVPDLLKFIPFLDWDRCKIARNELVGAFMSSSWNAGDLALTACRCGDVEKILNRVGKSYGGEAYLVRIENDLTRLDGDDQRLVKRLMAKIRGENGGW